MMPVTQEVRPVFDATLSRSKLSAQGPVVGAASAAKLLLCHEVSAVSRSLAVNRKIRG
jgi:hypothetical protein